MTATVLHLRSFSACLRPRPASTRGSPKFAKLRGLVKPGRRWDCPLGAVLPEYSSKHGYHTLSDRMNFHKHPIILVTMPTISITHRDDHASGLYDPNTKTIKLLRGSILTIDLSRTPPSNIAGNYRTVRDHVRNGDIRALPDGTLEVVRDIPDLSPSAARVFADGKVGSGWDAWKLSNGELLDSLRPVGAKPAPKPPTCSTSPRLARPGVSLPPSGPALPPAPPPQLPGPAPTPPDIVRALVAWIQADPYRPPGRGYARGWDQRIRTYAYAVRGNPPAWPAVYAHVTPLITNLHALVAAYNWNMVNAATHLNVADRANLLILADQVRKWGGVPRPRAFADAWKVIKSAVLNARYHNAPMNSGWTKIASFATDGAPNAQTIWDSRVSTSVIWRLDRILHANGLTPAAILDHYDLGLVAGRANGAGAARARNYQLAGWPNGYGNWSCHLAGSDLVRDMVTVLNAPNSGFPLMPQPNGNPIPWDVFGVGLVLFMDGY